MASFQMEDFLQRMAAGPGAAPTLEDAPGLVERLRTGSARERREAFYAIYVMTQAHEGTTPALAAAGTAPELVRFMQDVPLDWVT